MDFQSFLWNADLVYGADEDQISYRAEMGGILDAIRYTNRLCNGFNITAGACTIYCDSKGALCASFGTKTPNPRWASFDLVRHIRQALEASTITWTYQHVKGHQDNNVSFEVLDHIAQGNVIVDFLAAKKLRSQGRPETDWQPHWSLTIQNTIICRNLEKRLLQAIMRHQMIQKWSKILNVDESKID